mgnify:CR=1 FL=1
MRRVHFWVVAGLLIGAVAAPAQVPERDAAAPPPGAASASATSVDGRSETASEAAVALQFTLARSLSEEGAVPAAVEAWEELLDLAPDEPYARIEYARFLARVGRTDDAVEQAVAARRLAPANADVLRSFAEVHLEAARGHPERLEAARGALEALVELEPEDVRALFDLGRAYYEQGRWREAADWLDRAARRQPGNRMLQSYRVDAFLQAQQVERADRALRDLLAADPSFLRARLQLAALESDRGDHRGAASTLRAAPADQLGDHELRWQLAGQLYRLGELDAGVELLDGLLRDDPTLFRERMLKAMVLAAQGSDDQAREIYLGLHRDRPLNLDIVSELVKLGERAGEVDAMLALLDDVDRRLREEGADRRLLQVQFERLGLLWRTESWERLAREAKPLANDSSSPLQAQGVFYLVDALHGIGRSERALEVLGQAAADGSDPHRLAAKRAEILADLGRDAEAEGLLTTLAASDELSSMLAAAEVFHRRQRYDDAVAVLERAREIDGESSQVLYWLGAAYERSGDRERAAAAFERLLELDPQYSPALNYLGYMWAEQGENLDRALELVGRALAREPDNGAYVDSLGWAYFQLGRYDEARQLLERAARLVPGDAVISEHLGDVYSRLGLPLKAQESYRRAIHLDGDNRETVQRKLERLLVTP